MSDDLSGHLDEGAKNATIALAGCLTRQHEVVLISTQPVDGTPNVRSIPAPLTFLARALRRELRALDPDVLMYATRRSATFFSIARARVLRLYCPTATIVLFGWQTRRHPRWQQWLIRRMQPDIVVAQSNDNRRYLEGLGCRVVVMPSGVDSRRFHPVGDDRRRQLRDKHGLDQQTPIALHVGHLAEGRGIRVLAELAQRGGCRVILVASTSSPQQESLRDDLRAAGVTVLTEYLPAIEELYQLADCYLFPVGSTDNAIEAPLSVLEALACDLPVVTTRFGGLPSMFGSESQPGLTFVDAPAELVDEALRQCAGERHSARHLAERYAWDAVAHDLMAQLRTAAERSA